MKQDMMDVKQAAKELRLSVGSVRRLAVSGDIPGKKCGKRWFFKASDIYFYLTGDVQKECQTAKEHGVKCKRCWEIKT